MHEVMSSLQQTGRFLPFANNNIQRKQLSNQGGLPQSLSGSDTDVSTSNENLSNEERYVIRHTARQEPQGQENQQHSPSRSSSHKENIPNIQGNLINRNSLKESLNGSNRSSLKESLNGSNRNSLKDSINGSNRNSLKDNLSNRTSVGSNRSSLDISTSSYNTLIIHNANEENSWPPSSRLSGVVREHSDMGYIYCEGGGKGHSNSPTIQSLSSLPHDDHLFEQTSGSGCQEITDIPDDYLSQSQVLKHLAKEVKVPSYSKLSSNDSSLDMRMREVERVKQSDFEDRPQTNYTTTLLPIKNKHRLLGPTEKLTLSRSQPDLSRLSKTDIENYDPRTTSPRPQTKGREEFETTTGEIWPTSEMVQILIQENSTLKLELDRCYKKVSKSQQLEQEISKVHRAHEELVASCERREKLERAARLRLQSDCRRLTELNRALRDQIDLLSSRTESPLAIESMRKELTQKELFIGQLITQTKELAAAKERQEIELAAQRATLQEQRTHIDILDTALTNAQSNVVRLEEECRKKQMYVERAAQLQRALTSLQASSDRREETERQLRGQLERELREGGGGNNNSANGETIGELKRKLRERDEKIMSLEGDVAKWEQRYLEESALRQAAIDAASLPKDAKIAALEKTSQDAEKLIAEARSEKMRHMDEVHAAQKKLADLESRMKDLESKLAERDAMIRVLQKHTYDKDSSSSSGVGSYPVAHSSHSSTSADHHSALKGTPEIVGGVIVGPTSYGTTSSYGIDYNYRKQGSFEQTNKSLDDQLKELDSQLDSQLLSKRALCCFPGFSNPGAASRKGKIPKPLLAGVESSGGSSTASSKSRLLLVDDSPTSSSEATTPASCSSTSGLLDFAAAASRFKSRLSDGRPEDMMLLEKQGRSSQRQRMQEPSPPPTPTESAALLQPSSSSAAQQQRRAGSLPPSSLPRPPRSLKSSSGARYCRLSDSEARKKQAEQAQHQAGLEAHLKAARDSGGCASLEYGRTFDAAAGAARAVLRRKRSSESIQPKRHHQHHEYERLGPSSCGPELGNRQPRDQQARSLIPPPPRRTAVHPGLGGGPEYGRLSDGDHHQAKQQQQHHQLPSVGSVSGSCPLSRKSSRDSSCSRGQSTGSIMSTKSESSSTASLQPTIPTIMLKPSTRSIPRPSNYRIQF